MIARLPAAESFVREVSLVPPSGLITLLTDFGNADGYVAAMKGAILSINRNAGIVDLSHEIAPQDIAAAELLLPTHYKYFPRGTVHVAIVDPGVGTDRRALACAFDGHYFVAPDNGLLDFCAAGDHFAVALNQHEYWRQEVSHTFHGRDVFAPVAAHITLGVPLLRLGAQIALREHQPQKIPRLENGALAGEVIYIDWFGNAISNITAQEFWNFCGARAFQIKIAALTFERLLPAYGHAAVHEPVALIDSFERLEIGRNQGHAAQSFNLKIGMSIIVSRGATFFHHALSPTQRI